MRIYLNGYYKYYHFGFPYVGKIIGIFKIREDSLVYPPDGKIYLLESTEKLLCGHNGTFNRHKLIKGKNSGKEGRCWFITREAFIEYIPKHKMMVELL
jgi:hypothetical protein